MHETWSHQKHITPIGFAQHRVRNIPLLIRESMRARPDTEGARFCGRGIEMEPERQHAVQQRIGGLNVRDAFFDGPWPEAGCFDPFPDTHRGIAVRWNEPVGIRAFIKEDASHTTELGTQYLRDRGVYTGLFEYSIDDGMPLTQVAESGALD